MWVTREFLNNNPTLKSPGDYREYPGKLDHTTVACFRAGVLNDTTKNKQPTKYEAEHISIVKEETEKEMNLKKEEEKEKEEKSEKDDISNIIAQVINDLAIIRLQEANSVPGDAPILDDKFEIQLPPASKNGYNPSQSFTNIAPSASALSLSAPSGSTIRERIVSRVQNKDSWNPLKTLRSRRDKATSNSTGHE